MRLVPVACVGFALVAVPFCTTFTSAQDGDGQDEDVWSSIAPFFQPPEELESDLGDYDAETGVGLNPKSKLRDFGYQLTRRGFVSLSIGGAEDRPPRWKALNHTIAVNRLLGFNNRVAMTNREGHSPTKESNEQLYLFFEYFLKPETAPPKAAGPPAC
jgi:hypothetical protein